MALIPDTIGLSFEVACWTSLLGCVLGFPLAVWLAQHRSALSHLLESLLMLPVVLPPTVTGFALLSLLGNSTSIGHWANVHGVSLLFNVQAMVLGAFIVSLPFFVRTAQAALEMIPGDLIEVARLNGVTGIRLWHHVLMPLSWRGILAGLLLMFIRAFGDFGVTLMVSGNIPHQTVNASVALYNAIMAGDATETQALLTLIVGVTVSLFVGVHLLSRRFLQQAWG